MEITLSAPVAVALGGVLIFGAAKLLNYTFDRADSLFFLGIFGGFIPFGIGGLLILFCLLTSPPTIFGISVGHVSLPSLWDK